MRFRNWLFGGYDRAVSRAAEKRAAAVSNPKRADVSGLVEIIDDDPESAAGRSAVQGIAAIAEAYPERLQPVVPDLLVATSVEGPVPDHRAIAAEALADVARAHPDAVTQYLPAVEDSLREEVAAVGAVSGATFDERVVDALCAVLAAADTEAARDSLRSLRDHDHPVVSDAAARALGATSDRPNAIR